MLTCAYCGAALALEKRRGPERLILSHARDDAGAEAALRSFLIERRRRAPLAMSTTFSFMPFAMIEDEEGTVSVAAASAPAARLGGIPYPPAGHYRFCDGTTLPDAAVVPEEAIDRNAARVIHLPIYLIHYRAGSWRGKAAVIGESRQVIAEALPPDKPPALDRRALFTAAGLFAGYYVLGRLVPHAPLRLILIAAAAVACYSTFALHERSTGRG